MNGDLSLRLGCGDHSPTLPSVLWDPTELPDGKINRRSASLSLTMQSMYSTQPAIANDLAPLN